MCATILAVRAFACPVCNAFVAFEAEQCANCRAPLGFHLPSKSMLPVVDGSAIVAGQRWVACTQQATLGCNWLVPDGQTSYERGRCLAHSLIRREPVADDTLAREKLVPTAAALRRLVYQLDDIGLPIEPFLPRDGGLAFDLLSSYTTGDRVTIGHAGGVITIDLVESLDDYREAMRVRLGEPYPPCSATSGTRSAATRSARSTLQRLGNPPEIVGAALFLASDASSFTSGSIIRVDGGIP
jgi:hypothetical protein